MSSHGVQCHTIYHACVRSHYCRVVSSWYVHYSQITLKFHSMRSKSKGKRAVYRWWNINTNNDTLEHYKQFWRYMHYPNELKKTILTCAATYSWCSSQYLHTIRANIYCSNRSLVLWKKRADEITNQGNFYTGLVEIQVNWEYKVYPKVLYLLQDKHSWNRAAIVAKIRRLIQLHRKLRSHT